MEADTVQKRMSVGMHFTRFILPIADSAINISDSAQMLWLYTGPFDVLNDDNFFLFM